ncbi:MAG: type II toxin-antitoxin system mRNA interferase toxin, RelE/StbE family [Candidatus Andersenbacteria bacterium]
MELYFHRVFNKQYKKLPHTIQVKAYKATKVFKKNPRAQILRNHALKGDMDGRRAISVTGDVRIIFTEQGSYARVTFLQIGTHNQVY